MSKTLNTYNFDVFNYSPFVVLLPTKMCCIFLFGGLYFCTVIKCTVDAFSSRDPHIIQALLSSGFLHFSLNMIWSYCIIMTIIFDCIEFIYDSLLYIVNMVNLFTYTCTLLICVLLKNQIKLIWIELNWIELKCFFLNVLFLFLSSKHIIGLLCVFVHS